MSDPLPEPWLRGALPGIDPFLMPAAHALVHVREELVRLLPGLSPDELGARPGGAASIAFHVRHIAGATDRLLTYARGEGLDDAQREWLRGEGRPDAVLAEPLLAAALAALDRAMEQLRSTPGERLLEPRAVGRGALPSTVLGLLFHAAEHAQRHSGQIATTVKLIYQERSNTQAGSPAH
jgi:uncharacterized damage-inducible protein DinB